MASTDQIINDIVTREGGYVDDPTDRGGPTAYGISKVSNPEAWVSGPPTEQAAKAIYLKKYVQGPGFDKVADSRLQAQLVDFGVNSGPAVAVSKLQTILGIGVDGVLGPGTLQSLSRANPVSVNNQLVVARVRMIGQLVSKNPAQAKFAAGWLNRAVEFLI